MISAASRLSLVADTLVPGVPVASDHDPSLTGEPHAAARRLSRAVARGDEAAFRELYDSYQPRLMRLALVLVRGEECLAAEVVQAAFVTAAAKLPAMANADHLWNWLALVTRQETMKVWRQRRRSSVVVSCSELPDSPVVEKSDAQMEEILNAALQSMDAGERQIIEWFYFDHLSHQEIGDRLQATAKSISSRLERSRGKLRNLINRQLAYET